MSMMLKRVLVLARRPKIYTYGSPKTLQILPKVQFLSTTCPRQVNPLVYVMIKPLSRILGMVLGRKFRIWWKKLPNEEKEDIKKHFSKNWKIIGAGSFGVSLLVSFIGYETVIL